VKTLKPGLLGLALAALGVLVIMVYSDESTVTDLIRQAEAGSDRAMDQLEALSAAGELAEHSDLVGTAAARVSQADQRTEQPEGAVSRWHRLFFATDPLRNASEQTRKDFVRSLFRMEPNLPDEVIAGQEYSVGRRVVGLLRHDELTALSGYSLVESLESITVNGSEIWPSGLGSIATRPLAFAEGGASVSSTKLVLLDGDHTLAPGQDLTVRMLLDMSVIDDSTDPPTVFAKWTEELVATPKVKTVFASSPVLPRPGDAGLDEVLALLTQAEGGDEAAAEKLVSLGTNNELRPYADELGALLAEALRSDWRPRVRAYFDQHGWEPDRPGAHPLPKPNDQTALLIGLFYLAEPMSTATRETWLDVATAGVYAHHHLRLGTAERPDARLMIKTLTVLAQQPSLSQVSGMGITLDGVDYDGTRWPLQLSGSSRITSVSPEPAEHWRNHLASGVHEHNTAHGLSEEMVDRFSRREGQTIDDLRTHLDLRLLHDEDMSLANWSVTIDTPIALRSPTANPLDETALDRR